MNSTKAVISFLFLVFSPFSTSCMEKPPSDPQDALSRAIDACREADVVNALRRGARLDVKDHLGRTPVQRAAASSCADILKIMITHGGLVIMRQSEASSFNFTYQGNLITFDDDGSLLSKVIAIYLISECIYSPAAREKIKMLLLFGAPFPQDNSFNSQVIKHFFLEKPLLLVSIVGDVTLSETCLMRTPAPSHDDQEEALSMAVAQGHPKIVALLLNHLLSKGMFSSKKIRAFLNTIDTIMRHSTDEKYKLVRHMLERSLQIPLELPSLIGHVATHDERLTLARQYVKHALYQKLPEPFFPRELHTAFENQSNYPLKKIYQLHRAHLLSQQEQAPSPYAHLLRLMRHTASANSNLFTRLPRDLILIILNHLFSA